MSINIGGNTLVYSGYTPNEDIMEPNIVTEGLVCWYDAGHSYSAPGTGVTYYNCGYGCQYYSSDPGCEACADEWLDMSGFGNDLTNAGNCRQDYNSNGGGIWFPGENGDYYTCPNDPTFSMDTAITVTGWIKPTVWQNGNIFNNNYNSGWRARIATTTGQLWFYVSGNNVSGGSAPINQWSHFCCAGDSSGLAVYLNGELVDSNATAFNPTSAGGLLIIGAYNTTTEEFEGWMGTMQFYNRRLSLEEIRQNYHSELPRFDPSDLIPASPSQTPSVTPSVTRTPTPSITSTPSASVTPTRTPTPTPSTSEAGTMLGFLYNSGDEGLNITQATVNSTTIYSGTLTEGNSVGVEAPKGSGQTWSMYFNGVPGGDNSMQLDLNGSLDVCVNGYGNPTQIFGRDTSSAFNFAFRWQAFTC